MRDVPGPVTAADLATIIDDALTALLDRLDRDWQQQAGTLDWTCWETIEHTSDSLLFYATQLVPLREPMPPGYAFDYRGKRPEGPEGIVFAQAELGPAGLLRILSACGGLLVSMATTAHPAHRGRHMWGSSDAGGFAAMGIVEVAAHGGQGPRVAAAGGGRWAVGGGRWAVGGGRWAAGAGRWAAGGGRWAVGGGGCTGIAHPAAQDRHARRRARPRTSCVRAPVCSSVRADRRRRSRASGHIRPLNSPSRTADGFSRRDPARVASVLAPRSLQRAPGSVLTNSG